MALPSQGEHRRCFVRRAPRSWVYPCGNNTAQRGAGRGATSLPFPAALSSASMMPAPQTKTGVITRIKSPPAGAAREERFCRLLVAKDSRSRTALHNCARSTRGGGGRAVVFLVLRQADQVGPRVLR